jgi:serine/threonine protein kinase
MLRPGDVIDGRYLIGDLLGRGGMAEVHRATDVVDGRAYALKVVCSTETGADDRFRWEAEALARVDHPGLIRLHHSGVHGGAPYMVLDLAEGPPLSRLLADGPAGVDLALSVGRQVAEALAHVHRSGMVHRDVKPSNILMHRERALLADFGIARLPGAPALTLTGQVIGSAPYLAPEQVEGQPAGPAADVYALGLVLIECLTGRRCFPGTYAESALARLHRDPEVPPAATWLRHVLAAMTAREPGRRPSAEAVAEALARRDAAPVEEATGPLAVDLDLAPSGPSQSSGGGAHRAPSVPDGGAHRAPSVPDGGAHRGRTPASAAVSVPDDGGRAGRRTGVRALAAAAVVVLATFGWTLLGAGPRSQPTATPDPGTTPTTAPALVANPAPPSGETPSEARPRDGLRRDHATTGAAPAPGEVATGAAPVPAAVPAAVHTPAAEPTTPPEDRDVPPTTPTTTATTTPTTATSTPPPTVDDGGDDGTGSGDDGTGGEVIEDPGGTGGTGGPTGTGG